MFYKSITKKPFVIMVIIMVLAAICCCFIACENNDKIESFYKLFCKSESMRINFDLSGGMFRDGRKNCISYDGNKIYALTDNEECFAEIDGDKIYKYLVLGGEWIKDEGEPCVGNQREYFKDLVCQLFNPENYTYDKKTKNYISKNDITITVLNMQLENVRMEFLKKECKVYGVTTLAGAEVDVLIDILDINNVEIVLPTVKLPSVIIN